MKRINSTLLSFLLLFAISVCAQQVPKVVGNIAVSSQLSRSGPDANNYYGFQSYLRTLNINASGSTFANLVLKMRVYIENIDKPGDVSFIQNAGFSMIEFANEQTPTDTYVQWNIKSLNLKSGWNDLYLPLSTGDKKANFDLTKPLNWFRFCLARITGDPGAIIFRLKDIQLIDTSVLVDPPVVFQPDTTYLIGNIPYTMNSPLANGVTFSNAKSFTDSPINASTHDKKQVYLMFDANITEQTPGDIFVLSRVSGQIELSSSGKADVNEMTWGIGSVDWKAGQHTYMVPFSTGGKTGGDMDLSNINFIRFYGVNVPTEYIGRVQMSVSNVKLVDLTNRTKLPSVFGDKMMFQQNKPISIWGTANAGKNLTVDLYKNNIKIDSKDVTVPQSGKWKATFDPQTGSFDKYRIEVLEGQTQIQSINDILIGEIWLASGQSNMALSVSGSIDGTTLMANANNDNIRFLLEPTATDAPWIPNTDIQGAYWASGNDGMSVGKLSAVAYSMAVKLQQELNIPVGILNTAVGGSVIEAWLPAVDVQGDAALTTSLKRLGLYFDEDFYPSGNGQMSALYNLKINPLIDFGIKGMIWYQGESNSQRPQLYARELNLLKKSYERVFGFTNNDMPFIFCHVCPWVQSLEDPQNLAPLAEAMYDAWAMNQDDMAMLPLYDTDITYVGNVIIHPTNKTPVGKRFATSALNMVYNKSGEYTAAVFDTFRTQGDTLIVKFAHVGDGLKTVNGIADVRGFAICGEDSIYVGAKARIISANEVAVWNERVKNPKQLTYAWATFNVMSNLTNSVNIPAAPFRSERVTIRQKRYNPQDWTYADGDIWTIITTTDIKGNNNGKEDDDVACFMPSWTKSNNATLTYDETLKSEGKASLKVNYTLSEAGTASAEPVFANRPSSGDVVFTNRTIIPQLANFNTISFDVLNPDNRDKQISLLLKSGTATYKAVFVGYEGTSTETTSVTLPNSSAFRTLTFVLRNLKTDAGATVADPATVLSAVSNLQIVVNDNANGSVYIDNVVFGLSTGKMILSGVETQVESQANIKLIGNILNVKLNTNNPIQKIDIIDMQGRIIYTKSNINNNDYSLKLPVSSGLFIAKIQTEKSIYSKKIIFD